jgi:hypothetical protein
MRFRSLDVIPVLRASVQSSRPRQCNVASYSRWGRSRPRYGAVSYQTSWREPATQRDLREIPRLDISVSKFKPDRSQATCRTCNQEALGQMATVLSVLGCLGLIGVLHSMLRALPSPQSHLRSVLWSFPRLRCRASSQFQSEDLSVEMVPKWLMSESTSLCTRCQSLFAPVLLT